jgi:hypothetical protein
MVYYYIKHTHTWEKDKTNIAHFFHEYLFYAIEAHLINKDIIFVLDTKLSEWELQFTLLVCKHLNIKIEYSDTLIYIPFNDTKNINLHESSYFTRIINIIKDIVRKEYNIEYNNNYKVLYFRNDCVRRKMLNYNDELNYVFDKVITDMSVLSFEEQVKLFMGCSHLVTIDGAHLTNILFMNENAKIYNIITDNSFRCWTLRFGLYNCIKNNNFSIYLIPNTEFNDTIVYNNDIENNIKKFLGLNI